MKITKAHKDNCQIHTIPVYDSGMKHSQTLTCKCQPDIQLHRRTLVVNHNMMGNGPDDWTLKTKNFGAFTLEVAQ
jgi:hypothetical protein